MVPSKPPIWACALRVETQYGMRLDALRDNGRYDVLLCSFSVITETLRRLGLVEKTQNTFLDCLVRVPFLINRPQVRSNPGSPTR